MELVPSTPEVVNILLVDDKPNNLVALESFLSLPGYNLVTATSGSQALKRLQEREFAVILTDVMMPIMDGYEFATAVKHNEKWRDIPIIFLTAMASEVANIFRGYEVGAVDYMQKPLEPQVVAAKVAVFVQLFRQRALNQRQAEELLENQRREQDYKVDELRRRSTIQRLRIRAALRENATRSRVERLQTVHLEATRILAESFGKPEAIPKLLETVSVGFGWEWAAYWVIDPETNKLRVIDSWRDPGALHLALWDTTCRGVELEKGQEAPGQAWQTGEAEWRTESSDSYAAARSKAANLIGTHSSIAIPILVGAEVAGVAEFIDRRKAPRDKLTQAIFGDIAVRVGLYFQRLKAEQTLRESEEKFRLLVGGVKEYAIFMLDTAGNVTTWNEGARRLMGYEADDIIGKNFSRFYGKAEAEAGRPSAELALAANDGQHEAERLRVRHDGSTFSANTVITALKDSAGELRGFVQITRDISDRKLAEESLQEAYGALDVKIRERTAELEAANISLRGEIAERQRIEQLLLLKQDELRSAKELAEAGSLAKSAFLANMSHEIRTPLGAVMGFSELLLLPDQSETERANFVEAIKRNGKLLSNIINDILDLSKVEAGKLDVERSTLHLDELLTDLKMLLELEATEKGLKLVVETAGFIPSRITTDPLRLRQILLNIVGNAIKFTDTGTVGVRIMMAAGPEGKKKLAFVITDTGRGVTSEQARRLFEPFAQADSSTTRRFGGTGLGLALSKQLANRLGGNVELTESSLGHGSTFTVTIDPGENSTGDLAKIPPEVTSLRTVEFPVRSTNLKILLAEDSLDNQMLVNRMLRPTGATVDIVGNGRAAVEKAMTGAYAIVLMDLQMPEMDGYSAMHELRRNGYGKPIIALTAHAMAEDRERCLASGFDAHLSKPINRNALLEVVLNFSDAKSNWSLERQGGSAAAANRPAAASELQPDQC